MPRLKPLMTDQATSVPGRIQAYCPPILEASRALGAAPAKSGTLPAELRAIVQLRAAQMVKCLF